MDAGGLQRLLAGSFARTDPEIEVRVESSVERPRRTGVQGSRRLGSSRRSVLRSRRTKNAQDAADRYPSIVKRLETLGLADASVDEWEHTRHGDDRVWPTCSEWVEAGGIAGAAIRLQEIVLRDAATDHQTCRWLAASRNAGWAVAAV